MAYDEILAARVRSVLNQTENLVEKKMFGGLSFMVNGNMACGVMGGELCVRVGPDAHETALSQPHTRVFDFTGRPMPGWIMVAPEGTESEGQLKSWVDLGVAHALSLPPK